MTFVFDMDGTIADLYSIDNWLEKLRAGDTSPYRDAKPMWDMEELRDVLLALQDMGYTCAVISWLSKGSSPQYKRDSRRAKREWLEKYSFPANEIHLVAYGTNKRNYARRYIQEGILIDDSEEVRKTWNIGETWNPLECDIIEKLRKFLEEE